MQADYYNSIKNINLTDSINYKLQELTNQNIKLEREINTSSKDYYNQVEHLNNSIIGILKELNNNRIIYNSIKELNQRENNAIKFRINEKADYLSKLNTYISVMQEEHNEILINLNKVKGNIKK